MTDTSWIPGPALARELGVSSKTLARWTNNVYSGFPRPRVINKRLYFQRNEIEAWKEAAGNERVIKNPV